MDIKVDGINLQLWNEISSIIRTTHSKWSNNQNDLMLSLCSSISMGSFCFWLAFSITKLHRYTNLMHPWYNPIKHFWMFINSCWQHSYQVGHVQSEIDKCNSTNLYFYARCGVGVFPLISPFDQIEYEIPRKIQLKSIVSLRFAWFDWYPGLS